MGTDNPENYFSPEVEAQWLVFDGFSRKFNLAAPGTERPLPVQ